MKNIAKDKDNYSDIIDLSRPVSTKRPMSRKDRAGQFASFAALIGYKEIIDETSEEHQKNSLL